VTEERTTNVTLKTTLSKDGRLVYSAEDAAHDAMRAHELLAAYTAALTALEASDSDRQKLKARIDSEARRLAADIIGNALRWSDDGTMRQSQMVDEVETMIRERLLDRHSASDKITGAGGGTPASLNTSNL
jgi:hypothetical protein